MNTERVILSGTNQKADYQNYVVVTKIITPSRETITVDAKQYQELFFGAKICFSFYNPIDTAQEKKYFAKWNYTNQPKWWT